MASSAYIRVYERYTHIFSIAYSIRAFVSVLRLHRQTERKSEYYVYQYTRFRDANNPVLLHLLRAMRNSLSFFSTLFLSIQGGRKLYVALYTVV